MAKKSVLEFITSDFSISTPELVSKNDHKIVLTDANGSKIILEGSDLTYKNGKLNTGEIDSVLVENNTGKPLLSFTHIDMDVATLTTNEVEGLLQYAFIYGLRHDNVILGSMATDEINGLIGNDVMKGRGGDDFLGGGAGKDVLSGGGGEDQFNFDEGDGKDIIKDFDADGTDGAQDLIETEMTYVSIKNVKGNAVIDFGGGDTLTLVGVKANEIDASDFVV